MPCYHPITAFRSADRTASGKRRIVFSRSAGLIDQPLQIPCGQCIGCRLEKSRQWAMRCVLEASLYEQNTFLTLTYNDANLPMDMSVNKRHLQLFMKRLRKRFGNDIRFYAAGEYGDRSLRPHYHIILFNFYPPDGELIRLRPMPLYISESLFKLWPFGYHSFGMVTFDSAAYVARYCTKKITGPAAEVHYQGREPEFALMSRRPGIGAPWLERFQQDVYPSDTVVLRDGLKLRPPKYFDNLYDKFIGNLDSIKIKRRISALCSFKDYLNNDLNLAINSRHQDLFFNLCVTEPFLHDKHVYSENFQKTKLKSKLSKEVI